MPKRIKTPVTWNGVQYESLASAARANNTSPPALLHRLRAGYTCDDEVIYRKPCVWNGVQYASITECATAIGISDDAMQKRLARGYTCDDDMIQTPTN